MVKNDVVRLQTLELKNIKNVLSGKIEMPKTYKKVLTDQGGEVLGIYGQNGSGKTAVIDTLYYLQQIMIGQSIKRDMRDYIGTEAGEAEINVNFAVFQSEIIYEVGYHIIIQKSQGEDGVQLLRETLSCAKHEGDARSNKAVFMDYNRNEPDSIFTPKKRLEELCDADKENRTDLIVARKMAEKSNCSYIFGENSKEIFGRVQKGAFVDYANIIYALFQFALMDLFVIRNSHSGMISANFVLPMAFRIDTETKSSVKGDFAVSLFEPTVLNKKRKDVLVQIIEEINTVLYTIIPGLKIGIHDSGIQLADDGTQECMIELLSEREGRGPIPIRMESEGIIKIISILNALIQAFGNPSICLAIDELDAGIYEYMLGELLDIFSKSAKGQMVFTSHNLRALEMLNKESIMFSTANPNNRYIHMKNIKNSNNLRDQYIRSITLGGQNEVIYSETDSLKIARAFRKAGRSVENAR